MNGHEKSDSSVVPMKRPNKAAADADAAEAVEGRELAKGNPLERDMRRTQGRHPSMPNALERIREAARRNGAQRFTSLMHHVYNVERLRSSYRELRKQSAAGVDGVTWRSYGENLESNVQSLSERLKRGAYRAQGTRRAHIPKADGTTRPIGVPTLEDKLVQRSMAEVWELCTRRTSSVFRMASATGEVRITRSTLWR
jgi:RNA-directed DNA polymerase